MNESTVILTGVQINTPIYLGMKREYDFVHPMVDEFCRAAEFVPTPGEAPLHLVAGKGPFQRTVFRKPGTSFGKQGYVYRYRIEPNPMVLY